MLTPSPLNPSIRSRSAAASRWLAVAASVALAACGGEEKAEEGGGEAAGLDIPALGVLELPVSARASDGAPSGHRSVDLSPAGIRVDDAGLMPLESGKVPAAERQDNVIGKLKSALASPSKSVLALAVHASIPYETLALTLETAKAAGMRDVAFKVRKPGGGSTEAGWLTVKNFSMTPRTFGEVKISGVQPRTWDEFATAWDPIYQACRGAQTGSCAYVQSNVAKGGNLKIVLQAAGQGVNVNFFRVGIQNEELSDEEKKRKAELAAKKEAFLQGRLSQTDLEKELLEGPPATEALFQFRAREALATPSPVSDTIAPLCGKKACGAVVSAELPTMSVRVVSLIGAAFPDGAAPPVLAFEQPWSEKPKLSKEEIAAQAAESKTEAALQQAAAAAAEGE
ncbi:MAG: hypothetical protein OEZ06_07895 [Myxococcales bacterium]|nr:hypothetical protein [Myxococcales bacterium]